MEDMDIDHIVEVPDTPDRLAAQKGRTTSLRASNIQMEGSSRNTNNVNHGSLNWMPNGKKLAEVTRPNRRLHMHPPKRIHGDVEFGHQRNPIILSPSDKSSPHGWRHSFRSENTNKEKGICADALFRSCRHNELPGKIEGSVDGELEKLDMDTSDSRSSNILGRHNKGKDKVGENKSQGSAIACRENVDLSSSSKHRSEHSCSISSPGKRLVRNGFISPHNIAIRVKESAKESSKESKEVQPVEMLDGLVNGVVTDKNGDKSKGKGILMHPCSSKGHESKLNDQPSGHLFVGSNDDNGRACAPRDVVDRYENLGGWRSNRASLKYVQPPTNNPEVGLSEEDISAASIKEKRNGLGDSSRNSVSLEDRDAHRLTSGFSFMVNRAHKLPSREAIRQKNKGSTSKVDNGCSQLASDESEVVILGSGESVSSSSRSQRDKGEGNVGPVIAVDESSPHMRPILPEVRVPIDTQDSNARARQLEADEMLARELQEELYNESPVLGNNEIDEYVARMLQRQEENHASFASFRGQEPMRPISQRGSSTLRVRRRPPSQSSQNISSQRGARVRASNSRSTRSSRRGFGSSSSGGRNFQFPLDMDLDMRIDILEALETAWGDVDAVGTSDGILNIQRDFNENDYEMLLALDENNHHGGASAVQINSLPETKVQTETFEEACAICLETPTVGDTIRHLPCFHKFHKDCIDPWLSRKTSCPVCKSSIT